MSYKVDLLDRISLSKIKEVEVMNEPNIHEEINGSFTFDFEAHYTAKNDLTKDVIISVDGKYFKIAKVVKSRDDSITLSVHCEHVSYELIIDFELTDEMEYESDAQTMITEFLRGGRFNLVSCIPTATKYYVTKTLDIRKRLFEVADLFAGELIFDNYDVHLVQQRGSDKGLEIELGVNLLGVTEEQNFVENKTAYELDLLDLSNVSGYELDFSSAEIGDTITIKDSVLGINTNERILAINYNPFKKALPSVTVGDYIRDLTEYFKPTDEEEDGEEEKDIKTSFKQFKIGGVDMLKTSSDATDDVREYLTNKYVLGVEVSAKYNTLKKELTGIVAEKADGVSGILSVVQTKANANGLIVTTITEITSITQLSSVIIKDIEHVTLVISDRQLSYYKANPTEAENASIKAIGICVTFESGVGVFLERFNVGDYNVLSVEGNDVTEVLKLALEGSGGPPIATSEVEIEKVLQGLDVVPSKDYLDWYFTLIHGYELGEEDIGVGWNFDIQELPISNYADFRVTTNKKDSVMIVASNEPFNEIMEHTASEDAYYQAFGCTFTMEEAPPDVGGASEYFDEFRMGNVDMLDLVGDETDMVLSSYGDLNPNNVTRATYVTDSILEGLFVTLKEEYTGYYAYVYESFNNGSGGRSGYLDPLSEALEWLGTLEIPYNNDQTFIIMISELPIDQLTPENAETVFFKAFGITVTMGDDSDDSDDETYLEYGSSYLASEMVIYFEKGPYGEVASVTTGISVENQNLPALFNVSAINSGIYSHITITTEPIEEFGEYVGIVAYAYMGNNEVGRALSDVSTFDYMDSNIKVNIHAVCKKNRTIVDVEN